MGVEEKERLRESRRERGKGWPGLEGFIRPFHLMDKEKEKIRIRRRKLGKLDCVRQAIWIIGAQCQ